MPEFPAVVDAIASDSERLGFQHGSCPEVGRMLRMLAASKPGGRMLEIGTGAGTGCAWLLSGMDADSTLDSIDQDGRVQEVAHRRLGSDPRLRLHTGDGAEFLATDLGLFDLVFADAWPGKFTHLDLALSRVARGGFYVVDDLLPDPTWPEGHEDNVVALVETLRAQDNFASLEMSWGSGMMILARTDAA